MQIATPQRFGPVAAERKKRLRTSRMGPPLWSAGVHLRRMVSDVGVILLPRDYSLSGDDRKLNGAKAD
jgi:hypothetical protein